MGGYIFFYFILLHIFYKAKIEGPSEGKIEGPPEGKIEGPPERSWGLRGLRPLMRTAQQSPHSLF